MELVENTLRKLIKVLISFHNLVCCDHGISIRWYSRLDTHDVLIFTILSLILFFFPFDFPLDYLFFIISLIDYITMVILVNVYDCDIQLVFLFIFLVEVLRRDHCLLFLYIYIYICLSLYLPITKWYVRTVRVL